jgi:hypothetical protein
MGLPPGPMPLWSSSAEAVRRSAWLSGSPAEAARKAARKTTFLICPPLS